MAKILALPAIGEGIVKADMRTATGIASDVLDDAVAWMASNGVLIRCRQDGTPDAAGKTYRRAVKVTAQNERIGQ